MKSESEPDRSLNAPRREGPEPERPRFDHLNLPRCRTLDIDIVGHLEVVRAEYCTPKIAKCTACGCKDLEVDVLDLLFGDAPTGGIYPRRVQLFYKVVRCRTCGAVMAPPVSELLYPHHKMTYRLVEYILTRMTSLDTFERISVDTCQDAETIRNLFMAEFTEWEEKRGKDLPVHLGIDEVKIGKNWLIVFVDLDKEGLGIVDVRIAIHKKSQRIIQERLQAASNRDAIEIVTVDFSSPYRGAIQSILENAKIVGDYFHLVKILQGCFDKVRLAAQNSFEEDEAQEQLKLLFESFPLGVEKDLQNIARANAKKRARKRLKTFKKHHRRALKKKGRNVVGLEKLLVEGILGDKPLLKEAYGLKVAFEEIFAEPRTIEEGSRLLMAWNDRIPGYFKPYFKNIMDLVIGWHQEICRYFETGATNAMAECKNGLLRLYDLIGRGYKFNALRARALWADSHRRTNKLPEEINNIKGMNGRGIIKYLAQKRRIESILKKALRDRRENAGATNDLSITGREVEKLTGSTPPEMA